MPRLDKIEPVVGRQLRAGGRQRSGVARLGERQVYSRQDHHRLDNLVLALGNQSGEIEQDTLDLLLLLDLRLAPPIIQINQIRAAP